MNSGITIINELLKAWRGGGGKTRGALVIAAVSIFFSVIAKVSAGIFLPYHLATFLSTSLGILGGGIAFVISLYRTLQDQEEQERRVERAEQRVQENPNETHAAWDLARIKLESYLNRNLSQVRSIFWLTVIVMIAGFVLIGAGVVHAFEDPNAIKPAVLSVSTGVLVNFIGATFLVLYKSTMNQAKDYVAILERINAVGMSVQVLEKLEDGDDGLKHQTTAEISKKLLDLYKHTSES